MKKILSTMMLLLTMTATLSLTSCDTDDSIGYTLEGTWQGNLYMTCTYDGVTYQSTYTEICFLSDPYRYSSGYGYWADHYNTYIGGYNYVGSRFSWRVINGDIHIYFYDDDTEIWIEDYRLNDRHFMGRIYYGDTFVDFDLVHVDSPHWDNYYFYDSYYGYYNRTNADRSAEVTVPKRGMNVR